MLFLIARVGLSLWATVVVSRFPPPTPPPTMQEVYYLPSGSGIVSTLLEPWHRWDTNRYLKIAVSGYQADENVAFFPLYPLLIRVVGTLLGGQWLLAALLLSSLAACASFIVLYEMVRRQYGEPVAQRALLFLVAFPMSFFFFAAYTESIFLLFVLLAFASAQAGRWGRAELSCALAALTRPPGAGLVVPLILVWYEQYKHHAARKRELFLLALSAMMGAVHWVYLLLVFGDPGVWSQGVAWWRTYGWPGESILLAVKELLSGSTWNLGNSITDLAAFVFFIAVLVWGASRLPRAWTLYSVITLLVPLFTVQTLVPMLPLASLPRYGLVLFPVFVALALKPHPRLQMIGLTLSLLLQMWFAAFFVEWVWIA